MGLAAALEIMSEFLAISGGFLDWPPRWNIVDTSRITVGCYFRDYGQRGLFAWPLFLKLPQLGGYRRNFDYPIHGLSRLSFIAH